METPDRITAVEADGINSDARIAQLEQELEGLKSAFVLILNALHNGTIRRPDGVVLRLYAEPPKVQDIAE